MLSRELAPTDLHRTPAGFDWSFLAFFDILGFSTAISSASAAAVRDMLAFTRLFAHADGASLHPSLAPYGVKTYRFQDSYIRACCLGWLPDPPGQDPTAKATYDRHGVAIYAELIALCHIVINFMRRGLLLRGAAIVGEIDFADDYALGPGVIAAHSLESTRARWPRILIERSSLKYTMEHPWGRGFAPSAVSIDHDGEPFVDYLKEAAKEAMASPHAFKDLLLEHKRWIQALQDQAEDTPAVREKLDWLADYHNDTVFIFGGLERKTGWGYRDLALPEPDTAVARNRLLRRRGDRPHDDELWDRSWDLYNFCATQMAEVQPLRHE